MINPKLHHQLLPHGSVSFFCTAVILITVAMGCGWGTSTLNLEKVGFQITFPCKKYETPQPMSFTCVDGKRESYSVRFESISVPKYETRRAIYEGFIKNAEGDQYIKGTIVEKTVNGSKVLEYTEDEFEKSDSKRLIMRKRFVDVFKDKFLFEVSGWCRVDFQNETNDMEKRIKNGLDPFFESMILTENR